MLLSACGSDGGEEDLGEIAAAPLAPSDEIAIAIEGPVETIDPIFARSPAERLIAAQVHEPLSSLVRAPFGESDTARGPSVPSGRSERGLVWSFRIRSGLRFQDGTALDDDAVQANFKRWLLTGVAEEVIPTVEAVDSPIPGGFRFQLRRPTPDLLERLGDPRLGLVSPAAISERPEQPIRIGSTGAGAYSVSSFDAAGVNLSANQEWWGVGPGLGPGSLRLDLRLRADSSGRASLLSQGDVEIAANLDRRAEQELQRSPLAVVQRSGDVSIGLERSVRGVGAQLGARPLSEAWLTALP